jgi:hypothetical protein
LEQVHTKFHICASIMRLTAEQRTKIVTWYNETKSFVAVQRHFCSTFDKRMELAPSKSAIWRLVKKFETHGTIHNLHSGNSYGAYYSGRPTKRCPYGAYLFGTPHDAVCCLCDPRFSFTLYSKKLAIKVLSFKFLSFLVFFLFNFLRVAFFLGHPVFFCLMHRDKFLYSIRCNIQGTL